MRIFCQGLVDAGSARLNTANDSVHTLAAANHTLEEAAKHAHITPHVAHLPACTDANGEEADRDALATALVNVQRERMVHLQEEIHSLREDNNALRQLVREKERHSRYMCICMCMYVCIYTYLYMYIYVCVCIHGALCGN